ENPAGGRVHFSPTQRGGVAPSGLRRHTVCRWNTADTQGTAAASRLSLGLSLLLSGSEKPPTYVRILSSWEETSCRQRPGWLWRLCPGMGVLRAEIIRRVRTAYEVF